MNANEIADALDEYNADGLPVRSVCLASTMLRQQQAELDRSVELYTDKAIENEALKMGFAGNGTSDSELAEVRAQANRWFLKIKEQQAEIEALKKDNKELHAIAQRMAMAESDARKSLQWFKDVEAISSGENTILTDEEIADALYVADITLNNLSDGDISMERIKAFARAILRKAQEK